MGNIFRVAALAIGLIFLAACTRDGATPSIKIGTIVVRPIGLTQPTPGPVTLTPSPTGLPLTTPAAAGTAAATAASLPEATPPAPVDFTHPAVRAVLYQTTLVQHHHNPETGHDYFTCASRGLGLTGVMVDPDGPRFVGPNSMDFDLWGIVSLFKINPDGSIFLVPQQTGGRFVDPEGIEHTIFTLEEALGFFASGDAIWIGAHGEPGRIAECDPQYVYVTPTRKPSN